MLCVRVCVAICVPQDCCVGRERRLGRALLARNQSMEDEFVKAKAAVEVRQTQKHTPCVTTQDCIIHHLERQYHNISIYI